MKVIAFCIFFVFLFCSCSTSVGPNEKYTVEYILSDNVSIIIPEENSSDDLSSLGEGLVGNWITPGKVFVDGLFPGGRAEYFIRIHNGKDKDSFYAITSRSAGHFEEGYNKSVPLSWITIVNNNPHVKAGETVEIPVYLEMPLSYELSYKEKMEIIIGVVDLGQEGNVKVELCSKWLITTR
jgi:hypothetical protein